MNLNRYIPENCRNWSFGFVAFLALSLVPALYLSLLSGKWDTAFLCVTSMFFIVFPFVLQARFHFYIPRVFSFGLALFVYATLFLGEVNRFYYDVWWWDIALHSTSAFAFGLIGLIILMFNLSRQALTAKPFVLSLFAFAFALMIGALWEIFEFSGDQLFGLDMQKDGLMDTMTDLIIDAIGALAAAIIGYFYLTPATPATPLDPVIDKVVEENT